MKTFFTSLKNFNELVMFQHSIFSLPFIFIAMIVSADGWFGWYLLVMGVGGSLLVNASLNAAVVTGLLPATGLPFPFVSYGGSSLVTTAAGWGLVLNVSRYRASPRRR